MDRIIQSMENFLTTVPRFMDSELGRSLAMAASDGLDTTETFVELETALQQVQVARIELDLQQNSANSPGSQSFKQFFTLTFFRFPSKKPIPLD